MTLNNKEKSYMEEATAKDSCSASNQAMIRQLFRAKDPLTIYFVVQ